MRSTRTPEDLLTAAQRELAQGVRDRLQRAGARFREGIDSNGTESWHRFTLDIRPERNLSVEIFLASDVFQFLANSADLRLEAQDAGNDPAAWAAESLRVLDALLDSELRIRVRRTLFGRSTGAVWVPIDRGAWNGDPLAYLGFGREDRLPRWLGAG
jgi:hypothetical protein